MLFSSSNITIILGIQQVPNWTIFTYNNCSSNKLSSVEPWNFTLPTFSRRLLRHAGYCMRTQWLLEKLFKTVDLNELAQDVPETRDVGGNCAKANRSKKGFQFLIYSILYSLIYLPPQIKMDSFSECLCLSRVFSVHTIQSFVIEDANNCIIAM